MRNSIFSNANPQSPPAACVASRRRRDSGHLLLAILLMMALMVVAAMYVAPRLVQQIKRDREEEMIHRGTEYARAIKKYYKKFGSYPASLEQLENTNQIRFLRKRYKDPLTKDGKWTLLHYGDVAAVLGQGNAGIPAAALASQGQQSPGTSMLQSNPVVQGGAMTPGQVSTSGGMQGALVPGGAAGTGQQTGGAGISGVQASPTTPGGAQGNSQFGSAFTVGSDDSSTAGGASSNTPGTAGAGTGPGITGGQPFGGGAIVGVASISKDPTIRVYNKKKTYNEWQFIYNPLMDQTNTLLRGPYSPTMISNTNIGTPAGQLNQGPQGSQQQSPFGQQNNSGFGNQPSSGTQPPQPAPQQMTPSKQYPPEQ